MSKTLGERSRLRIDRNQTTHRHILEDEPRTRTQTRPQAHHPHHTMQVLALRAVSSNASSSSPSYSDSCLMASRSKKGSTLLCAFLKASCTSEGSDDRSAASATCGGENGARPPLPSRRAKAVKRARCVAAKGEGPLPLPLPLPAAVMCRREEKDGDGRIPLLVVGGRRCANAWLPLMLLMATSTTRSRAAAPACVHRRGRAALVGAAIVLAAASDDDAGIVAETRGPGAALPCLCEAKGIWAG